MCQILAYVYMVEHKAMLVSAFFSVVHHFNTAMTTLTACWAGISGSGDALAMRRTVHEECE